MTCRRPMIIKTFVQLIFRLLFFVCVFLHTVTSQQSKLELEYNEKIYTPAISLECIKLFKCLLIKIDFSSYYFTEE